MKLTHINVENFEGLRRADLSLHCPVTIIAGFNAAGKSSLRDAITIALFGEAARVTHKKDYGQLVTDGAKKGRIAIGMEVDGVGLVATVSLPDGKTGDLSSIINHPHAACLPYVLNASRFSHASSDERRTLLFGITGSSAKPDAVRERLARKGADTERIEAIIPMLRSGFPAACEDAKRRATEARGAWKATTGETYGDKKAIDWKAEAPAYDADLLRLANDEIAALDTQSANDTERLGAIKHQINQGAGLRTRYDHLKGLVDGISHAAELVTIDAQKLEEFRPQVEALRAKAGGESLPCPAVMHALAELVEASTGWNDAKLANKAPKVLKEYEPYRPADIDRDAADRLPDLEKGLKVLENALENRKRDLAQAELAKIEFAAMVTPASVAELETQRDQLQHDIAELERQKARIIVNKGAAEQAKTASESADRKTEQASRHHASVATWTLIAEALSPDGIPAEILSDAIKPVNKLLMQRSAEAGWEIVKIEPDMAISFGGRSYGLLSESEKWRTDAVLTLAIAQLSGLRVALLDGFDIIQPDRRGELIQLLDSIAEQGAIDTVIALGTLKAAPQGLPLTMEAFWIDNGIIETPQTADVRLAA